MDDLTQLEDEELTARIEQSMLMTDRLLYEMTRRNIALRIRNPVPKRSEPASETSSVEK